MGLPPHFCVTFARRIVVRRRPVDGVDACCDDGDALRRLQLHLTGGWDGLGRGTMGRGGCVHVSCPVPPHHTTAACYLLHCCLLPAACYLLPATCCWMLQTTCCLLLLFAASPDARCCCLRCRLPPPLSPTRSSLFPFPTSESQFLSARCGGPATRRGQAGRLRPSPGESPSLRRRRYSKTRCWNQRRRQDQSSSPQAQNAEAQ